MYEGDLFKVHLREVSKRIDTLKIQKSRKLKDREIMIN
jgi:hypothetical protein